MSRRQVTVPIWGKQGIPLGRLEEVLALLKDPACCVVERLRTGPQVWDYSYRVFRYASAAEASAAILKDQRKEPRLQTLFKPKDA